MALTYRASSAATITLASLAASSTLTAGQCSTSISNATNVDDSILANLLCTAGTSPTVGLIELWAFQQRADTTWPELFSTAYVGTNGAFTVTSRDALFAGAVLLQSVPVLVTSNQAYALRGGDLAERFGSTPQNFAFFVTHSTAAVLNATAGNHSLTVQPAKYS